MKVLNRNTFTEELVSFQEIKKGENPTVNVPEGALGDFTLVTIGKSLYSLEDLEAIIVEAKRRRKKDFNEVLNYRVRTYTQKN